MSRPLPAVLVLLPLACAVSNPGPARSTDARCTFGNCDALAHLCRGRLPAEPDYAACLAGGAAPAGFDASTRVRYCVAACNALQAGEVVACVAEPDRKPADRRNVAACVAAPDDVDTGAAVALLCPLQVDAPPSCLVQCQRRREICDKACPTDDFLSCAACRAPCGLAWGNCVRSCETPEATDGGTPDAGP